MCQAPNPLGAHLPALTPNHFVSGLCARVAQNKFIGYFKIRRPSESHAAVALIYNEAVARCCARFCHDDPDMTKAPPHRAPSIIKSVPDHGATNRLVKHPHAPLSENNLKVHDCAQLKAFAQILTAFYINGGGKIATLSFARAQSIYF
jgi:hypothetical protein